MSEHWIEKARELIISLSLELENCRLEREAFRAVLETAELHPETLTNWRNVYQDIVNNPPSSVKEKFGKDMLPVIDFAIQGLPPEAAQVMLGRVRRLFEGIQ